MSEFLKKYDVIIIGGGPAGLSAAIYTARAGRSTLIIEKAAIGGQVINTSWVENYPGFESIGGIDLTQTMYKQAKSFGADELYAEVTGIKVEKTQKIVETSQGDLNAEAIIVAGGLERQKLDVPGEAEFIGKGVSYCATCDGAFFKNKAVAVVGGGNAAITEALELTRFVSKVTIIHRRNELRATKAVQEKAFANPKIEFLWDTVIEAITGEAVVTKVKVNNVKTGQKSTLDVAGVFMAVGFRPNTGYLQGILKLDDNGSVITDAKMETGVPGILAAGDVRSGSIRQLVAAAGDGAVAAISAEKYLSE